MSGAESGQTWNKFAAQTTEFPMDTFHVAGHRSITVLSVEAVNMRGLRIANVAFVPGDGIGSGFRYGDPASADYPAALAARREMPGAVLTPLTASSDVVDGAWSRLPEWQTVIGVVPTVSGGGTIDGLIYTYEAGGQRYVAKGTTYAALTRADYACSPPNGS